jgi:hypothetical protein
MQEREKQTRMDRSNRYDRTALVAIIEVRTIHFAAGQRSVMLHGCGSVTTVS